ncbi:MAG: Hpt domain-containing protein [Planctomycetaceae bacterium]|nr:Hpt domain-containing protein [Planctomycetaceae bacterium]
MDQTSRSDDTTDVINVSAALARMGGDAGLLADVAGFFLEDAPELMSQMRVAVRDQRGAELAHAAHTLKGLASNFDAVFVQKLAAELESRGFAGRFEGTDSMLEELEREAGRVEQALKEHVLPLHRS